MDDKLRNRLRLKIWAYLGCYALALILAVILTVAHHNVAPYVAIMMMLTFVAYATLAALWIFGCIKVYMIIRILRGRR